jgi:formylglycine-generating enzyme required for sulfatase activity
MQLMLAPNVLLELVTIPAGEFWMGSDLYSDIEKPRHEVSLPEFWIGKYEVTNAQFDAFVNAKGYPINPGLMHFAPQEREYPVVNDTWYDAQAFCQWVSVELLAGINKFSGWQTRLPTEAEWEKAARGPDGRQYPWGEESPDDKRCNYSRNIGQLTPVGQFSPLGDSPYGCADMAGNVWEWTHSLFKNYPYHVRDGRESETESGERVVRGGSMYNFSGFMRCTYRSSNDPAKSFTTRGFRLCVSPIRV